MQERFSLSVFENTDVAFAMKRFIREHYGEALGAYVDLLDQPGGLDALAQIVRSGQVPGLKKAA